MINFDDPPGSHFLQAPAVHHTPVKVEPLPGLGILKRIVCAKLPGCYQSGHETGLLAVDQRMGATVPGAPLALDEAKDLDEKSNVTHVMHDVLKPPLLDDLVFVDPTDRIVGYQARLVRSLRPGLLVVHDVGDFVVVRAHTVLLDVVAAGIEFLDIALSGSTEASECTIVWLCSSLS